MVEPGFSVTVAPDNGPTADTVTGVVVAWVVVKWSSTAVLAMVSTCKESKHELQDCSTQILKTLIKLTTN